MLSSVKQVVIRRSDLVFCNVKPYVVATRGLRGRRLQDAVCASHALRRGPEVFGHVSGHGPRTHTG